MIILRLTNVNGTIELPLPEAPFTENIIEGAVDVVTEDNSMSTYFSGNKRQWVHTWDNLTKDELDDIWKVYEQQTIDYLYPYLSILGLKKPVNNVKVRMYPPNKSIIDDCETYSKVQVSWREA